MIEERQHIDGIWKTTEYFYKGRKILIKARKGSGMKAHIFYPDSDNDVDFTLRFSFVRVPELKKKINAKIDALDNKQDYEKQRTITN